MYQAQNGNGCPVRTACLNAQENRTIERTQNLERHKGRVRESLLIEIREIKRRQRTADVEPVFAHIKSNRNFKRFTHIGIGKAELEFGFYALVHNLKKHVIIKNHLKFYFETALFGLKADLEL